MPQPRVPRSPNDTIEELVYLPRMLDKIRLFAAGELPEVYHKNLGHGLDDRCCHLFGVSYDAIRERTLQGGTDADVLAWLKTAGRALDEEDFEVWSGFMCKRGWRDQGAERLATLKRENGLADRDDIVTFFEFLDADEGRPSGRAV